LGQGQEQGKPDAESQVEVGVPRSPHLESIWGKVRTSQLVVIVVIGGAMDFSQPLTGIKVPYLVMTFHDGLCVGQVQKSSNKEE